MDDRTFDTLVRSLLGTRRSLVAGLLAVPLGWLGAPGLAARKKDKPKKPKNEPKPNQYGCLEIGDPCKRPGQCCSGVCKGKKGKQTCRAHDTATCEQGVPGVCTAPNPLVTYCRLDAVTRCFCFRTTAGSNVCAANFNDGSQCADCQKDADCQKLGYPRGTACAPVSKGLCGAELECETGMACVVPCGATLPEPAGQSRP